MEIFPRGLWKFTHFAQACAQKFFMKIFPLALNLKFIVAQKGTLQSKFLRLSINYWEGALDIANENIFTVNFFQILTNILNNFINSLSPFHQLIRLREWLEFPGLFFTQKGIITLQWWYCKSYKFLWLVHSNVYKRNVRHLQHFYSHWIAITFTSISVCLIIKSK